MRQIVSMDWVKDRLSDPQTVIVDCRFVLGKPDSGKNDYLQAHLPGAHHMDLERDLSGPRREHGGRHPLPDPLELAKKLGNIGIAPGKAVVAYDDQGGAMASRFWWLLKYLGHDQVYVMDEGFTKWKAAGYPVTADIPLPQPLRFEPKLRQHMLVHMEGVKERVAARTGVIIDSRDAVRYHGWEDHVDRKAGHIPGALHMFWKDCLDESGKWKTPDELKQRFRQLARDREIVVYCGSGVTACANFLALTEAGYHDVKLYPGSWSDWCSYDDNPIAADAKPES